MKTTVYKIRRNSDGLFSMGGSWPQFNKNGKIWKQKGHLTSHLNLLYDNYGNGPTREHYNDCEIVVYELVETPIEEISIASYRNEITRKMEEKEFRHQQYREKIEKERRFSQFEELKKEFE